MVCLCFVCPCYILAREFGNAVTPIARTARAALTKSSPARIWLYYFEKCSSLSDAEKIQVTMDGATGVCRQLPLSAADGSPLFSFRVFTIEPGGHTPFHAHPFEHLNYVIEGSGVLVQESGRELALHKGACALVLPHEKHQYRNSSGSDPFIMICAVPKQYE